MARLDRGADLGDELGARDHLLAIEVAAALGRHLVLDVDRRHAARLVFAHGARHVELVAVAGVGIGDQRDADRARHDRRVVDHLAHGEQAEVGVATRGRSAGAGHVDGLETGLLDQARADAVVGAGGDQHAGALQQRFEGGGGAHRTCLVVIMCLYSNYN